MEDRLRCGTQRLGSILNIRFASQFSAIHDVCKYVYFRWIYILIEQLLIDSAQFIHALLRRDNGMQLVAFIGPDYWCKTIRCYSTAMYRKRYLSGSKSCVRARASVCLRVYNVQNVRCIIFIGFVFCIYIYRLHHNNKSQPKLDRVVAETNPSMDESALSALIWNELYHVTSIPFHVARQCLHILAICHHENQMK